MHEVTGLLAKTIHRLLEYSPAEGFRRKAEEPLEGRLLIVGEASMIDMPLVVALLAAVPEKRREGQDPTAKACTETKLHVTSRCKSGRGNDQEAS